MHLYWGASCKTPGCTEIQIQKYIGPSSEWVGRSMSMGFPPFLQVRCRKCKTVQDYIGKDLRQIELRYAPPPDGSIQ